MKTIEIIIDGKTYQAQMSVDEIKKLVKKPVRTGYERVEVNGEYYVSWTEKIGTLNENNLGMDDIYYNAANYYSDKTLAENNARADKLMRQLRRFAVVENAKVKKMIEWADMRIKYRIYYDYSVSFINSVAGTTNRDFGGIYFASQEIAKKAIETFKDELTWYFTEYKDYYVEEEKNDWLM